MAYAAPLDLKKEFHRAFEVAKLNPKAMQRLAKDRTVTRMALLFMLFSGMAGAFGSMVFPLEYGEIIYQPTLGEAIVNGIVAFLLSLGSLYLIHLIANILFRAEGSFFPFVRAAGYGYVIGLLYFFPILSFVIMVWMLLIWERSLVDVKKLSHEQAIVTLLLLIGVYMLLFTLAWDLNPAHLYGGLYLTP